MPKSFLIKKVKELGNVAAGLKSQRVATNGFEDEKNDVNSAELVKSCKNGCGRDKKSEAKISGKHESKKRLAHGGKHEDIDTNNNITATIQNQNIEGKKTRYVCGECGKAYATSSNLSRHKQTHRSLDSKLAKKCEYCGKAYVSMPALSMHLLTHKLLHRCRLCGKAFSRPWLLQGHMRSHTGERPYRCAQCSKAFADRSNLRAHMQTHSPFKQYKCERCDRTFALKSYLNKHAESSCFKESNDQS